MQLRAALANREKQASSLRDYWAAEAARRGPIGEGPFKDAPERKPLC